MELSDWSNTKKLSKFGPKINFSHISFDIFGPRVLCTIYTEFCCHGKWGTGTRVTSLQHAAAAILNEGFSEIYQAVYMYLRLAVSVYSILKIVNLFIVEFFLKCECFCAFCNTKNMPRTASCRCPQHPAWGHVDDVVSLRMASAKEIAFEIAVP